MRILRQMPPIATATLVALAAMIVTAGPAESASSPLRVENVELETVDLETAELEKRAGGSDLERFVRDTASSGEGLWVGYAVPARPGEFTMCCAGHWKRRSYQGTCHLENRHRGFVFSEGDAKPFHLEGDPSPEIHVLIRLAGGGIDRIEAFSEGCPLDAGGVKLVWLRNVDDQESVDLLDALVAGEGAIPFNDRGNRDEAMAAMAFHAQASATAALERHARTADDDDLREEAIFWLGEARERPGYEALVRLARDLTDSEVREHITFALSQSPVPEAERALIDMARTDRDPDVRSQALFWLGQEGGDEAAETILRATREDPDHDVREEAVFALSQLPDDQGVERLLAIARDGSYPTEVRKQALFWLGQSEDPRALDLLAELLQ